MDVYVFYYNDSTAKVFAKNTLTSEQIQQLQQSGYKKYPVELEAENKQAAIAQLNANSQASQQDLKEFSTDNLLVSLMAASASCLRLLIK